MKIIYFKVSGDSIDSFYQTTWQAVPMELFKGLFELSLSIIILTQS